MRVREQSRRQFLRAVAAGCAVAAAPIPAWSADSDSIIEGAKNEKGLVWYDHYDRKDVHVLFDAFQKKYPFLKEPQFIDVPSAQKEARILQESMAGGPTSDILLLDPATIEQMAKRGFVHDVDWKQLGVEVTPTTAPNPHMALVTSAIFVALTNKNLVADADAPTTWDQAVDAKWAGRTGHWMRTAEFPNLIPAFGEDKVRDLVRKLAALKPRLFDGLFPLAQAVGSGEIAMCITAYDSSVRVIETGAPVRMTRLDVSSAGLLYGCVLKFGPSPNTAKLFLSWLATTDGALVFEKATRRGNWLIEQSQTAKFLKGGQVSFLGPDVLIKDSARYTKIQAELDRILAGRG
jgi:iron(III) transport system substrate-binding protein